ncbi:hypothetical protein STEG23_006360, partial [Scotinomys teguina]
MCESSKSQEECLLRAHQQLKPTQQNSPKIMLQWLPLDLSFLIFLVPSTATLQELMTKLRFKPRLGRFAFKRPSDCGCGGCTEKSNMSTLSVYRSENWHGKYVPAKEIVQKLATARYPRELPQLKNGSRKCGTFTMEYYSIYLLECTIINYKKKALKALRTECQMVMNCHVPKTDLKNGDLCFRSVITTIIQNINQWTEFPLEINPQDTELDQLVMIRAQ